MAGSGRLALRTLPGSGWVRGSCPAVLSRLQDAAVVRPGFLSKGEEETLSRELEPELRRRRYEYDHWDALSVQAIHGFRETEKSRWSEASRAILQRVQSAAFGPGQTLLSPVHVLDLEPRGYIKPHVDSVKFCGATIAGLSLLSPSVMRLVHTQEPGQWLELLLEPGSLYILRGVARYDFSHEILRDEESFFGERRIPRGRRISVICRSLPEATGPGQPPPAC
ncbi:alpha-ketoglutarate-dependent dioxygenase alkB homolog 7, mitochondrial isoform X1 [Perognathus longimembris pacificus]|uniref:alpha-ketoglutarate-dependent dioxygenase alkB homolog 7, mitochondrial isoform X1 n=1 Tax=Perognathus longimembris pacificus TaxID=214514 RepID=UPI00201944E8|nr:alpha-ketoglutarate-dependent dioxygenase alkB homolog 7, mitochondrial isoform X1 [Perognathus longimembris pacificus]